MFMVWGGECQRGKAVSSTGYSATAQCTGKPSYLKPNSQSMQKSIERVYRIGDSHSQKHVKNAPRTYLERIRNTMQKPIEGLSQAGRRRFIKGRGLKPRAIERQIHTATNSNTKAHPAPHGNTQQPQRPNSRKTEASTQQRERTKNR